MSDIMQPGGVPETEAPDDISRTALLLDHYGGLLTTHQADVLDLHSNRDMSLAEIAQELNISRQAVHAALRAGRSQLLKFEDKLGWADRSMELKSELEAVVSLAESIIAGINVKQEEPAANNIEASGLSAESAAEEIKACALRVIDRLF